MAGHASAVDGRTSRELVRFYLRDHRTPVGKSIDVVLLSLILVFVALFVVETYPAASPYLSLLFRLEVAISTIFLTEYALRIDGARDRVCDQDGHAGYVGEHDEKRTLMGVMTLQYGAKMNRVGQAVGLTF